MLACLQFPFPSFCSETSTEASSSLSLGIKAQRLVSSSPKPGRTTWHSQGMGSRDVIGQGRMMSWERESQTRLSRLGSKRLPHSPRPPPTSLLGPETAGKGVVLVVCKTFPFLLFTIFLLMCQLTRHQLSASSSDGGFHSVLLTHHSCLFLFPFQKDFF